MSIDARIREGLTMIEKQLPEVDAPTAYEVVTQGAPRTPGRARQVSGLVAAAAVIAALAAALVVWRHHDAPTSYRPLPAKNFVMVETPKGLRYVSGDGTTTLPAPQRNGTFGDWSPDGNRVAYGLPNFDGTSQDLWVSDATGATPRRLYHCDGCQVAAVDWSPDGTRLAYVLRRADGTWSLRVLTLATGATQDFSTGHRQIGPPRWSPDGTRVSLVETRDQAAFIDVLDPSVGRSSLHRVVGPIDGMKRNDWSPDGTRFAFTAGSFMLEPGSTADLYVVNADGTGLRRVTRVPAGTRLSAVEWENHGEPFLVSVASPHQDYEDSYLARVSSSGAITPLKGPHGRITGVRARLRY